MASKTLLTTQDYAQRTATLERQIASLERRRNEALQRIAVCKKPLHLLLTLFAPLYRRSLTLEAYRLRQEVSHLDGKLLDVQAEYDVLCAEQQQRAHALEENDRLTEQEANVQREYRWVMLQEHQRKLKRQKAALEKAQAHDRLHEEAIALQRQHTELQKQLSVVREQLGENRNRRKRLDDRLPDHTLVDVASYDTPDDATVSTILEIFG